MKKSSTGVGSPTDTSIQQKSDTFDFLNNHGLIDKELVSRTVEADIVSLEGRLSQLRGWLEQLRGPAPAKLGRLPKPRAMGRTQAARSMNRAVRSMKKAVTSTPRKKATAANKPVSPPAASKPSRKQVQSRKLQGQYLALVRQFPKRDRAQFSKIAAEQGRGAAINAMKAHALTTFGTQR
jgi:hypothetical protein